MKYVPLTFIACALLITSSCQTDADAAKETTCYERDFSFKGDPDKKDHMELTISIDGEEAEGSFNWIPAEKDARTGSFKGTLEDNIVTAEYSYTHEGTEQTVPIIIDLTTNQALIKGQDNRLGMEVALNYKKCK